MGLQILLAWSIVAALAYLFAGTVALVILAVRLGGFRDAPPVDHDAFSASRFTIPVSLVVPVSGRTNREEVDTTVAALLALNYPTCEVIVVGDGPSAHDALTTAWDLEAREVFYRATLPTAAVRMMYRSSRDARLLVVDKMPATESDALNCGVNLARFRYIAAVEPAVTFDGDALLRAMTAPLRDPAHVVGATSCVEIRGGIFQRLRSIRSLMESRVMSRYVRGAVEPRGAVVVWRRDAVEHAGGFSADAADPHLDMTMKLPGPTAPNAPDRVVRTAEIFGHREPWSFIDYVRQTQRRQLAALQSLSALRAARSSVRPLLAYFFVSDVLTPCAQAWVILATAAAAGAGWLAWTDVAWTILLLAAGQAAVSAAALLVRGAVALAPDARSLRQLLILAPFEFLVFGAAAGYARVTGLAAFMTWQVRSSARRGAHGTT